MFRTLLFSFLLLIILAANGVGQPTGERVDLENSFVFYYEGMPCFRMPDAVTCDWTQWEGNLKGE